MIGSPIKYIFSCTRSPNFEWCYVDAEDRKSAYIQIDNLSADKVLLLQEKGFNARGGSYRYSNRMVLGYRESDGALIEIKGYLGGKVRQEHYPMFVELACSGIFDKIDVMGVESTENDFSWKDLPEEMLDTIVKENPRITQTDPWMRDKFGAREKVGKTFFDDALRKNSENRYETLSSEILRKMTVKD